MAMSASSTRTQLLTYHLPRLELGQAILELVLILVGVRAFQHPVRCRCRHRDRWRWPRLGLALIAAAWLRVTEARGELVIGTLFVGPPNDVNHLRVRLEGEVR